jgi:hypothetical protein
LLHNNIAERSDFKNEETALQYLGSQLGVQVLLIPKFHANLQGKASNIAGVMQSHFTDMFLYLKRGEKGISNNLLEIQHVQ